MNFFKYTIFYPVCSCNVYNVISKLKANISSSQASLTLNYCKSAVPDEWRTERGLKGDHQSAQ